MKLSFLTLILAVLFQLRPSAAYNIYLINGLLIGVSSKKVKWLFLRLLRTR